MWWPTFIYNREKNEIFGNTLISWQTLSIEQPNWSHKESLLELNPGLSFRPRIPFDKSDSSIIIFNSQNSSTYQHWIDDLKKFLTQYEEKQNELVECKSSNLRSEELSILPDFKQDENPCKDEDFGYGSGEPCFLIKLNRIFFWEPSPYRSHEELPEGVNVLNVDLTEGKGLIVVECNGETQFDKENIEKISYWPYQGFPADKFPYKNQKHYLSPFIMVRLKGIRKNIRLVSNVEHMIRTLILKKLKK